MTLRTRKPASQGTSSSATDHTASPDPKEAANQGHPVGEVATADASSAPSPESTPEIPPAAAVAKKLPRVILKVGPRPET